jgi:hypothetical protein
MPMIAPRTPYDLMRRHAPPPRSRQAAPDIAMPQSYGSQS